MLAHHNYNAYNAVLYHGELDEANADSTGIGYFATEQQAVTAIRETLTDYWQTGSVHKGTMQLGVLGVSPDRFDEDESKPALRVGPDWTDR